ncbi:MAG TPA: ATP-binding protein [Actinomycetota bacterium]|nr:ATP-binding protein [Actinomycetota bacterium]
MSLRAPSSGLHGFRSLPLFWKLLIPFLALIVFVGAFGAFLIVRDLSSRARANVHQDLLQASLNARATLKDRELYLLESANFAANLDGMAKRVRAHDSAGVTELLESVLALKSDLTLLAVTDRKGVGLIEFYRAGSGGSIQRGAATRWAGTPFVARTLNDPDATKAAGFLRLGNRRLLAIATPICADPSDCRTAGVAIVGIATSVLAREAAGESDPGTEPIVTIYDARGEGLAGSGTRPSTTSIRVQRDDLVRRTEEIASREYFTLYAPLELQGRQKGMIAVSLSPEAELAAVRGAGMRLAVFLLIAMAGIVGIGALLSRFILAQLRPLLATNRALGKGELSARAPVVSNDELGELARGVNEMAEQLQASYETLEMRVDERTEEVQRLLKERTEFFASLSHELRTPLAIILGQAQMMRDSSFPKQNGWAKQSGHTIEDSAQQLLSLVNDILDLARAEAGSIDVNPEDVDLLEFVDDMRQTVVGLVRGKGLEVRFDVPSDMPKVRADQTRLRQIILNLVDNAVKYTPVGGKVDVKAAATPDGDSVEVSVSDTGVGIPPEAGDLIFEPFFRVKGTRSQRGEASTGLGLALTRRLVEAQGGTIAYESQPGVGTTVTFSVPIAMEQAGDPLAPEPTRARTPAAR